MEQVLFVRVHEFILFMSSVWLLFILVVSVRWHFSCICKGGILIVSVRVAF